MTAAVLVLVLVPASTGAAQPAGNPPTLRASLTGRQVLPDPGPGSASAQAVLQLYADQVCWDLTWDGLEPTAAFLHRGDRREVGPAVVGLFEVQQPIGGTARQGCQGADPGLLQAIVQRPGDFYIQLQTLQQPGGAARGQLSSQEQAQELPRTGLGPPTPVTQIVVVLLVGIGLLLRPLADHTRQRRAR